MGATVDLNILNYITEEKDDEQLEFIMEVTDKTRADIKVLKFFKYYFSFFLLTRL